jgi:coenzyme F420 hydrogenase subunit beta
MPTISKVVELGLCCGCGTCAGICPTEAIDMRVLSGILQPKIDPEKCNLCGLCFKSCPGHSVDFESLSFSVSDQQPKNFGVRSHLSCYVGHSTNGAIRYNSASGGIATQLLVYAFEKGLIDGALVTRMSKDNPMMPEAFIARTAEEVIAASKTKYCPVAANTGLRQILEEKGRFAVVGLPCHIHGIRKAEQVLKVLRKRIVLRIGLLCSHMVRFEGVDLLVDKLHVEKGSVRELTFRGEGWPGSMSVSLSDGSTRRLPLIGSWHAYWPVFSSFFFTPMRCTMCPDQAAELADVSLGDAWLPEFKSEKSGESLMVIRTNAARDLFAALDREGAIRMKEVEASKVVQSQFVNLVFKKKDLGARLSTLRRFGVSTPKFVPEPNVTYSLFAWLRMIFMYSNIWASKCKPLRSLLVHAPLPVFRAYYGIYKYLSKV